MDNQPPPPDLRTALTATLDEMRADAATTDGGYVDGMHTAIHMIEKLLAADTVPSPLAKLTAYLADVAAHQLADALGHGKDVADVAIEVMKNGDEAIDDLESAVQTAVNRANHHWDHIAKINAHIIAEYPGELTTGANTSDCAIRIMKQAKLDADNATARADRFFQQIAELGDHLMAEFPGEPRLSEGAIDCAIRVMTQIKGDNAALRSLVTDHDAKPNWPRRYKVPVIVRQALDHEQDEH